MLTFGGSGTYAILVLDQAGWLVLTTRQLTLLPLPPEIARAHGVSFDIGTKRAGSYFLERRQRMQFAVFSCGITVAADEMIEKLQMLGDVTIDIHRHKAGQLQKARIDIPAGPRVTKGHDADAIALKPCAATLLRQ